MSRVTRGIVSPTSFRTPQPNNPSFVQVAPQVEQFNQLQQIMAGVQRVASAYGSYTYSKQRSQDRTKYAKRQAEADKARERNRLIREDENKVTSAARRWWTENPDAGQIEYQEWAYDQKDTATTLASTEAWDGLIAGSIAGANRERDIAVDRQFTRDIMKLRSSGMSPSEQTAAILDGAENSFDPRVQDMYLSVLPDAMQREVSGKRQAEADGLRKAQQDVSLTLADFKDQGLSDSTIESMATDQYRNSEGHLKLAWAAAIPAVVNAGDRAKEEEAVDEINELITEARLPENESRAVEMIQAAIDSRRYDRGQLNQLRAALPGVYDQVNRSAANKVSIEAIQAESTDELYKIVEGFLEGPHGGSNAAVSMARALQQRLDSDEAEAEREEQIGTLIKALNLAGDSDVALEVRVEDLESMIDRADPATKLALTRMVQGLKTELEAEADLQDRAGTALEVANISSLPTAAERFDALNRYLENASPENQERYATRLAALHREVQTEQAAIEEAALAESTNRVASTHLPQNYESIDPDLRESLEKIWDSGPEALDSAMDFTDQWLRNNSDLDHEVVDELAKAIEVRIPQWQTQSNTLQEQEQKERATRIFGQAAEHTADQLRGGEDITSVLESASNTYDAFGDDWGTNRDAYWGRVLSAVETHFNDLDLIEQGSFLAEINESGGKHGKITDAVQKLRAKYVDASVEQTLLAHNEFMRSAFGTPEGTELLTSFIEEPEARTQFVEEAVDKMRSLLSGPEFKPIRDRVLGIYREKIQEGVDRSLRPMESLLKKHTQWMSLNEAHRNGKMLNSQDLGTLWDGDPLNKALIAALDEDGPEGLATLRAVVNGSDEVPGIGARYLNSRSSIPQGLIETVDTLASSEDNHKLHQAAIIIASSRMHNDFGKTSNGAALRFAIGIVYPPGQPGRTTISPDAIDTVRGEMVRFQEAMVSKDSDEWDIDFEEEDMMTSVAAFLGEDVSSETPENVVRLLQSNDTFMAHFITSNGSDTNVRTQAALTKMRTAGFVVVKEGMSDRPVFNFVYDPQNRTSLLPELRRLQAEFLPFIQERGARTEIETTGASNIPWETLTIDDIEISFSARDAVSAEPGMFPMRVGYGDKNFVIGIPQELLNDVQAQEGIRERSVNLTDPGTYEFTNLSSPTWQDWWDHTLGRDSIFPWGTNSAGYYPMTPLARENTRQKEPWTPRPEKPKREFPPN